MAKSNDQFPACSYQTYVRHKNLLSSFLLWLVLECIAVCLFFSWSITQDYEAMHYTVITNYIIQPDLELAAIYLPGPFQP